MFIVNPHTNAVSTHSATPTHVFAHEGVLFGAAGDELLSFDAESTKVTIETGDLLFDSSATKNVPNARIAATPNGKLTMSVMAKANGRSKTYGPYLAATGAGETEREYRVKLGGGHVGNTYAFTVNAVDGAQISSIEVDVYWLRRDP